jgi:hypothetical protein
MSKRFSISFYARRSLSCEFGEGRRGAAHAAAVSTMHPIRIIIHADRLTGLS